MISQLPTSTGTMPLFLLFIDLIIMKYIDLCDSGIIHVYIQKVESQSLHVFFVELNILIFSNKINDGIVFR